jgi:hypothetical protein
MSSHVKLPNTYASELGLVARDLNPLLGYKARTFGFDLC